MFNKHILLPKDHFITSSLQHLTQYIYILTGNILYAVKYMLNTVNPWYSQGRRTTDNPAPRE